MTLTGSLLVLDANIVIGWCFGRNMPSGSRELLARVREQGAAAPDLLKFEVGRVIERRAGGRRLSSERADWWRRFFVELPITYDPVGVKSLYLGAWRLAEQTRLTVKDAAYLELAIRSRAPLATRDRPLREAAKRKGVVCL